MGLKALTVGVFKRSRPFILSMKASTLGVLKSGRPHLDFLVGFTAEIVMLSFTVPILIPPESDGKHVLNEDEEAKRYFILSGYGWITLLVSSLTFRWIRLWYFDGDAFWNFSVHHNQEGTVPGELVALKHGDRTVPGELVPLKHGDPGDVEV